MASSSLARSFAVVASILAVACGPGAGSSSDAGSSTSDTTADGETTSASTTTSPVTTTTTAEPSTSLTGADEGSTTGVGEPVEYVGQWDTGFGFSYFTACGETDQWFAEGLPGYEICSAAPLWLRVTGVMLPPFEGDTTPRLQVMEILEGPCSEGSCDGSTPIGGSCGTFEELCEGASPAFECDPFLQDCPVNEKCAPWANDGGMEWNGTRCAPVAGTPGMPGDSCAVDGDPFSGLDDCELGSLCWDVDPATSEGQCVALCDYSLEPDPVCPMGTTCTPFFTMEPPWTLGVCVAA